MFALSLLYVFSARSTTHMHMHSIPNRSEPSPAQVKVDGKTEQKKKKKKKSPFYFRSMTCHVAICPFLHTIFLIQQNI